MRQDCSLVDHLIWAITKPSVDYVKLTAQRNHAIVYLRNFDRIDLEVISVDDVQNLVNFSRLELPLDGVPFENYSAIFNDSYLVHDYDVTPPPNVVVYFRTAFKAGVFIS